MKHRHTLINFFTRQAPNPASYGGRLGWRMRVKVKNSFVEQMIAHISSLSKMSLVGQEGRKCAQRHRRWKRVSKIQRGTGKREVLDNWDICFADYCVWNIWSLLERAIKTVLSVAALFCIPLQGRNSDPMQTLNVKAKVK